MKSDSMALIQEFLQGGSCLIVEPSQAFSSSIHACLQTLGISSERIAVCRKFDDAKRLIEATKPRILVTEYEIEKSFGLALVEAQERFYDENARISIIVTKNSSDSAVAEAAEEQIDSYLLKPLSADTFKQKFLEVIHRKTNPSDYAKKIRNGKQILNLKEFRRAADEFQGAKPLNEKPTLACYYAGQSFHSMGDVQGALNEFKEGRRFQPLHYKCLVGEFESLMMLKKYVEAFALVSLIRANYPVTSRRLGQMFVAAVFSHHFDELPKLYELFLGLDQRPADLVKITSMALLTAGRHFVQTQDLKKAAECFDLGLSATGREITYLDRIVNEFLKVKAADEAESFLTKANAADVGTAAHSRIGFKVDQMRLRPEQLVERGRQLIMKGHGTPEIYELVIKQMAMAGKLTLAETVISKAVETNPEMRAQLYRILEESAVRKD